MSKEVKSQIYYLARRGWHDQLAAVCDGHMAKKGKDPTCVFWKAFALGMTGNLSEASRLLETFQARRDMQYPATLALIYFNRRSRNVDHDLLSSLQSELSVSEDVVVRILTYIIYNVIVYIFETNLLIVDIDLANVKYFSHSIAERGGHRDGVTLRPLHWRHADRHTAVPQAATLQHAFYTL